MARGRPIHEHDDFSIKHPKMSLQNRAKLFAPFDALNGFGEAILERNKITDPPGELSADAKELLDRKFHLLLKKYQNNTNHSPLIVTVTYFQKDWKAENIRKDGVRGNYLKLTGMVSRIDVEARFLQIVEQKIQFDDIYMLSGGFYNSRNVP